MEYNPDNPDNHNNLTDDHEATAGCNSSTDTDEQKCEVLYPSNNNNDMNAALTAQISDDQIDAFIQYLKAFIAQTQIEANAQTQTNANRIDPELIQMMSQYIHSAHNELRQHLLIQILTTLQLQRHKELYRTLYNEIIQYCDAPKHD